MCFRLLFSVLIFQVVFTSSEGLVPHMLTKRSSKSRMGEIIEIGDPTVEHATQYLTCRGVTENISSVLNITGTPVQRTGCDGNCADRWKVFGGPSSEFVPRRGFGVAGVGDFEVTTVRIVRVGQFVLENRD